MSLLIFALIANQLSSQSSPPFVLSFIQCLQKCFQIFATRKIMIYSALICGHSIPIILTFYSPDSRLNVSVTKLWPVPHLMLTSCLPPVDPWHLPGPGSAIVGKGVELNFYVPKCRMTPTGSPPLSVQFLLNLG